MRKKLTKEQSRYTTVEDEDELTKTQEEGLDTDGDLQQSRVGELDRKWRKDIEGQKWQETHTYQTLRALTNTILFFSFHISAVQHTDTDFMKTQCLILKKEQQKRWKKCFKGVVLRDHCIQNCCGTCTLSVSPCFWTSVHPQIHIFNSRPGGHCHHHSVVIRQTHSQCLCLKLLRPPPALCSGCGDEMVRKRWCF